MTATVEIESRRRLFLGSVVPFTMLLAALVAVPRLVPGGVAETYRAMLRAKISGHTDSPSAGAPCGAGAGAEAAGCSFNEAITEPVFAASHRKSALGVVDRWEQERRNRGGQVTISPADLLRLRRALL